MYLCDECIINAEAIDPGHVYTVMLPGMKRHKHQVIAQAEAAEQDPETRDVHAPSRSEQVEEAMDDAQGPQQVAQDLSSEFDGATHDAAHPDPIEQDKETPRSLCQLCPTVGENARRVSRLLPDLLLEMQRLAPEGSPSPARGPG